MFNIRIFAAAVMAGAVLAAQSPPSAQAARPTGPQVTPMPTYIGGARLGFVYQLQNYRNNRLDEVAGRPARTAVVDLARDGATGWFSAAEIRSVRATGKRVFAYFEIGSIETFRPEYRQANAAGLRLSSLPGYGDEYWGKYWAEDWWRLVVKPRLDRALATGFDGVYLDTIVAYEEIPLRDTGGLTRAQMATRMSNLIARISAYAKQVRPTFLIVPQNSPELRTQPGYLAAIDGFAQENLWYNDDGPCVADWCAENLRNTLAIQRAGKFILAIDYPTTALDRRRACMMYVRYGFTGTVQSLGLDSVGHQC